MFNTLYFFLLELESIYKDLRLQNSPYFCVFKYARAVKQKVWNCKQAVFYKAKLPVGYLLLGKNYYALSPITM